MAETVAAIGNDIAEVLEGVPASGLRKEVTSMAQLFEVTRYMVSVEGCVWHREVILKPPKLTSAYLGRSKPISTDWHAVFSPIPTGR